MVNGKAVRSIAHARSAIAGRGRDLAIDGGFQPSPASAPGAFQVLGHSGRPNPYDAGWKDTVSLAAGQTANILMKFSGYRGRYVFHCHNLEHEDMAMMANFEVV